MKRTRSLSLLLDKAPAARDDTCPVCLEPISNSKMRLRSMRLRTHPFWCSHGVCGVCDDQMTRMGHDRCPMCRAKRRGVSAWTLQHSFHCTAVNCSQPLCTDTKKFLARMESHVQQCRLHRSREVTSCKVCKLFEALRQTTAL